MAQHTPGPWRVSDRSILVGGGPNTIATVRSSMPEFKANARLIAAAPDLLEAAKAAREAIQALRYGVTGTSHLDVDGISESDAVALADAVLPQLDRAIAKVKGQQ